MTTGIRQVGGTPALDDLLSRGRNIQAAIERIYPLYQKIQVKRFETQNQSEGTQWDSLSPEYKKRKLKKYAQYPYSGQRMMIGTSFLASAVIGKAKGSPFSTLGTKQHRFMATQTGMLITIEQSDDVKNEEGQPFNYAGYANEKRNFTKFSDDSINALKAELKKFIIKG